MAAIFGLVIIGLTCLISIAISHQASSMLKKEIGNTLSTTAYQLADKLDYFMWSRIAEIDVISELEVIKNHENIQETSRILNEVQSNIPAFSWVGLTNANGTVVAATNNILQGVDISERPVYTEALSGTFIGDVHDAVLLAKLLPNKSGEPLQFVDISKPIVNQDGQLVGVLASHLSWEWSKQVQNEIITPLRDEVNDAEVFIISKKDNTVLLGPKSMVGTSLQTNSVTKAQRGETGWEIEKWSDGKDYVTGYSLGDGYLNYKGLGWVTIVRIPVETAFTPVKDLQLFIVKIGVVSSLIFAMIGWFLTGFVTKPLQQISQSANLIRSGRQAHIPSFKGIKDIEILSSSLKDLVDSLVKTVSELGKMEELANRDKLTGLENRTALEAYTKVITDEAKSLGHTISFLYMDLDGFKNVNDTYGHDVGDLLLQAVANRMQSSIKQINGDIRFFRLGGDEFLAIYIPTVEHSIRATSFLANLILSTLNKPYELEGKELTVGASIGGAIWPLDDPDLFTVMRYADEALYASKRSGKNKFTFKSRL